MPDSPFFEHLLVQFNLHTELFNNAVDGITNEDAQKCFTDNTNHIVWLAGALVSGRFELAAMVGIIERETFSELFADNKPINRHIIYPTIKELQTEWYRISPIVANALSTLTHTTAGNMPSPFKEYYILEDSFCAATIFMIDRESYIIGQIALLRKMFGYSSMHYPFQKKNDTKIFNN